MVLGLPRCALKGCVLLAFGVGCEIDFFSWGIDSVRYGSA